MIHVSDKKVSYRDIRPGIRVRRIEGENKQSEDIGREGVVQTPTRYNIIGGNMVVKYDKTDLLPEKIDDCCTPFEFEILYE